MQKLKDMKIKKRLNTGFKMVTGIATIAAVLGIIAMLVASGRYEYAMTNYGFSQEISVRQWLHFQRREAPCVLLLDMMRRT